MNEFLEFLLASCFLVALVAAIIDNPMILIEAILGFFKLFFEFVFAIVPVLFMVMGAIIDAFFKSLAFSL